MTGPVSVPGQPSGGGGDEYWSALFTLMSSVLTLAGLVDQAVRASDWAARRRTMRAVDQYLVVVSGRVDVLRSWLDLSSQRPAGRSAYRGGGGVR